MTNQTQTTITKSDFLLYCEAPRHLWAKKHGSIEQKITPFDQHLIDDGSRVESLGQEYLSIILVPQNPGDQLLWQQTYTDGSFETRLDGLVFHTSSKSYDLYEIKSSTKIDKKIIDDVTFQATVLDQNIKIDHYFVLHLDKEYIRSGKLDLSSLFIADDISDKVSKSKNEVAHLRDEALRIAELKDPDEAEICFDPKNCPCPEICHPGNPEFSIYDIPRLSRINKLQLLEKGIREAKDIPLDFNLDKKQRLVAERARTNTEHLDRDSLQVELDHFEYPLWFLDYETCISAIPLYDGHHPQQQIVFQYSLHCVEKPGDEPQHFGHIAITETDPAISLLEHLSKDLGSSGTILVWNKTFEMTRNKEMARVHPEYEAFLMATNERICDLADIVNYGYYLHPGFKGSWSIKNVLPVMVPELSYDEMEINEGGLASVAWWNLAFGNLQDQEEKALISNLEKYCKLDTMAMVEIAKKYEALAKRKP
jgi:hypothetical protein